MKLPVMFRWQDGEVTAVFPTLLYDDTRGDDLTCYAHIGQHGAACWEWIASTREATAAEAADLLVELTRVYHDHELLAVQS